MYIVYRERFKTFYKLRKIWRWGGDEKTGHHTWMLCPNTDFVLDYPSSARFTGCIVYVEYCGVHAYAL